MSELGIFIDESGIFEANRSQKDNLRDLYIVSFLFHNKSTPIDDDIKAFESFLVQNGFNAQFPIPYYAVNPPAKTLYSFGRRYEKKTF